MTDLSLAKRDDPNWPSIEILEQDAKVRAQDPGPGADPYTTAEMLRHALWHIGHPAMVKLSFPDNEHLGCAVIAVDGASAECEPDRLVLSLQFDYAANDYDGSDRLYSWESLQYHREYADAMTVPSTIPEIPTPDERRTAYGKKQEGLIGPYIAEMLDAIDAYDGEIYGWTRLQVPTPIPRQKCPYIETAFRKARWELRWVTPTSGTDKSPVSTFEIQPYSEPRSVDL